MPVTKVKEFWRNKERKMKENEQHKRRKPKTHPASHWQNRGHGLWQKSSDTNYDISTRAKQCFKERKVPKNYPTSDLRRLYKTPRSKIAKSYVTPNLCPRFDMPNVSRSAENMDFKDLVALWKSRDQRKSRRKKLKNHVKQVSRWEKEGHGRYKKLDSTGSRTVAKTNQRNKQLRNTCTKPNVKKQIAKWEKIAYQRHEQLSGTGTKRVPNTRPSGPKTRVRKRIGQWEKIAPVLIKRLNSNEKLPKKRLRRRYKKSGISGAKADGRSLTKCRSLPIKLADSTSESSSESSPEPAPPVFSMYARKKYQH